MNKKEISIYLDGISAGTETLFLRHLETINRLSRYEESGVQSWLITDNANSADMFFLGEEHHFPNPVQLARPILFDGIVPTVLRPVAVRVKFPMTSNALRDLMQETLQNFKPVEVKNEEDDRKITIRLPERNKQKITEKEISVEKPSKKSSKKNKNKNKNDSKPFFEYYLKQYSPKEQAHTLTFKNGKTIYINRLLGKIFADCENIGDLVAILIAEELPQITAFDEQHSDMRVFPFDAVLWSYGLHAPVSNEITQQFDITGQKIQLKKWPLFGKWETDSKLLFLATLFSQKAVSLREAEVKSEQDKDFVLHFIAAAELAGLSFEIEQTHETEEVPTTKKKKSGWIRNLKQKFNKNNN